MNARRGRRMRRDNSGGAVLMPRNVVNARRKDLPFRDDVVQASRERLEALDGRHFELTFARPGGGIYQDGDGAGGIGRGQIDLLLLQFFSVHQKLHAQAGRFLDRLVGVDDEVQHGLGGGFQRTGQHGDDFMVFEYERVIKFRFRSERIEARYQHQAAHADTTGFRAFEFEPAGACPQRRRLTIQQNALDGVMAGGKIERQVGQVLNYPVSWSARHIRGDGKKTWAQVATSGVEENKEK